MRAPRLSVTSAWQQARSSGSRVVSLPHAVDAGGLVVSRVRLVGGAGGGYLLVPECDDAAWRESAARQQADLAARVYDGIAPGQP
jgi:hypothetical protein